MVDLATEPPHSPAMARPPSPRPPRRGPAGRAAGPVSGSIRRLPGPRTEQLIHGGSDGPGRRALVASLRHRLAGRRHCSPPGRRPRGRVTVREARDAPGVRGPWRRGLGGGRGLVRAASGTAWRPKRSVNQHVLIQTLPRPQEQSLAPTSALVAPRAQLFHLVTLSHEVCLGNT